MSSSAQNNVLSQFVNCPTLTFRVLLLFLMRFVCLPESMYFLPFMRSFVSCLNSSISCSYSLFPMPSVSVCVCHIPFYLMLLFVSHSTVSLCPSFIQWCLLSSWIWLCEFFLDGWLKAFPALAFPREVSVLALTTPKSVALKEDSVSLSSESLLAFFVLLLFLCPMQCRSSVKTSWPPASPKKDSHHLADEGGSRTVQSKKITTWLVFHSSKQVNKVYLKKYDPNKWGKFIMFK